MCKFLFKLLEKALKEKQNIPGLGGEIPKKAWLNKSKKTSKKQKTTNKNNNKKAPEKVNFVLSINSVGKMLWLIQLETVHLLVPYKALINKLLY